MWPCARRDADRGTTGPVYFTFRKIRYVYPGKNLPKRLTNWPPDTFHLSAMRGVAAKTGKLFPVNYIRQSVD